jgi:hypothetical protein
MRYLMLAVFSAMLLAPLVGCESHDKDTTSKNPITGTVTHEHDSSMTGTGN